MEIELSSFKEKITKLERNFEPKTIGLEEEGFVDLIELQARVIKEETGRIWLEGEVSGRVKFQCDRCLEEYSGSISKTVRLLYDPKEEVNQLEDDTFVISSETLDLGKYLRDSLILGLPSKNVCSPECKGLCAQCGINLNIEACDCEKDHIDPRLEKLKKIKDKMEE